MTPQPLNSEPVQGPVEGRGVAEIRADLALARFVVVNGRFEATDAWHRLARDVPSLLAEVEAAHRFERSAAVDSARLAAVEALVTDAECSVGWLSHADADWRVPAVRASDLRVALAAAADAPQPTSDEQFRRERLGEWTPPERCPHTDPFKGQCVKPDDHIEAFGGESAHAYEYRIPPGVIPGPSPAVLPEKEQQR